MPFRNFDGYNAHYYIILIVATIKTDTCDKNKRRGLRTWARNKMYCVTVGILFFLVIINIGSEVCALVSRIVSVKN